eukprot:Skav218827  [mRNA]  locus=scaffold2959:66729:68643:- [translate_table: standard]
MVFLRKSKVLITSTLGGIQASTTATSFGFGSTFALASATGAATTFSFSSAADHIFFCWSSAWRCLRFHSSRFC